MYVSQWKLIRMEVVEVNIFKDPEAAKNQLPMLDRLWQAECRLERSYSRAQRELERLQTSRRQQDPEPEEPAPQPAAEAPAAAPAASEPQPDHNTQSASATPRVEPTFEIRNPPIQSPPVDFDA